MRIFVMTMLSLLVTLGMSGQKTDTLTFFSKSFGQTRTVYVVTPEFYKYRSDSVKLPVFYILDGQHDWFVNPVLTTVNYLQYTHEIPQALIVIIPHVNRNKECAISDLQGEDLPLHKFITEELNTQLAPYHPNQFRLIIGHSFSASFALYSYLKSAHFYSAVIAHSPMDHFEELIINFQKRNKDCSKISISVGGVAKDKDYYHRRKFDELKLAYPTFFDSINVYTADQSSHNAVPIVATPFFLTKLFSRFSSRYSAVASVNEEYKLIEKPKTVEDEMLKIQRASLIGNFNYSPEIPDINGLASRYLASGYSEYAISAYEMGLQYFPKYYEFHLFLYELYVETDAVKARFHLNAAKTLLETVDRELQDQPEILRQIEEERKKNGW